MVTVGLGVEGKSAAIMVFGRLDKLWAIGKVGVGCGAGENEGRRAKWTNKKVLMYHFPWSLFCKTCSSDAIPMERKQQERNAQLFHSVIYGWHVRSYVSCFWNNCGNSQVHCMMRGGGIKDTVFHTLSQLESQEKLPWKFHKALS